MTIRIGIADAEDPRVARAAERIVASGSVTPVLFGGRETTVPQGAELVIPPPGTTSVEHLAQLVGSSDDLAAGVAGSLTTSAEVVRAGIRHVGRRGLVSACFALGDSGAWRTYADCVVVPEPTVEQLADIAAAAADHHHLVFHEPARVAMLSFSTGGSAHHPRVQQVREATELLRRRRPDVLVDGEIQFDVAVDPVVAARKAPGSAVAGKANVLVFPSLEAANIAYKVAERVGGARALGSFVLGLNRPWVDLSRGCSVDDIVETVLLLDGTRPQLAPTAQPVAS